VDWYLSLIRLGLSLLLSFPIGWNREQAHKTAGLRTHLLVSLGSCLFTLIGLDMAKLFGGDASRIASQVVTGIGFLGGGAILRERFTVRGITTAASIWGTSAVGMACGAGFYPGAVVGAAATFLVLAIVERWEEKGKQRGRRSFVLKIRVQGGDGLQRVLEALETFGVESERLRTETESEKDVRVVRIEGMIAAEIVSRLVAQFLSDPDVIGVESEVR
jgi:putative Mg2+ transporter-C (MgtC) family protein